MTCSNCEADVTYPHIVIMNNVIAELCDDCYGALAEESEAA